MPKPPQIIRPTFEQALQAWHELLRGRGYPSECLWLFEENLCFERQTEDQFTLAYQLRFTPTPPEAERLAYGYFAEFEHPIVFYRIGSAGGKSLCVLLCDPWLDENADTCGFIKRGDWYVYFYPGKDRQVEEVTERERWTKRVVRGRAIQPLDFCLTLRSLHETLVHGRMLSPYEHYAMKFLNAWRESEEEKNKLDN